MFLDSVQMLNQLTRHESTGYHLFDSLLSDHFLKFRLFYELVKEVSWNKIKDVDCDKTSDTSAEFKIEFSKDSHRKTFQENLVSTYEANTYSKYFSLTVSSSKKILNISIENKDISREDEIHENRFDKH